jgi:hypothetical protein
MSGGRFDYKQYQITQIIDVIEQEIIDNNADPIPEEWFEPRNYSEETIAEFRKGIDLLRQAQVYAQRIDWLLSSDDGEDQFHQRLKKDLSKLTK